MDFDNLNWHDSIIKKIIIDRNAPGINDNIQIEIEWPNGVDNIIIFKDTYWADFNMNFGIVSEESILKAHSEGKSNQVVNNIYLKWKGYLDKIELSYYEIVLNSTSSKIRIVSHKVIII